MAFAATPGEAVQRVLYQGQPSKRDWTVLRTQVDDRLLGLESYRYSWWVHWRDLADYMLPRRYRWLITANQWNRGSPINQRIIDPTATLAARTLAAGMMSGITSPGRPWFRLSTADDAIDNHPDVKVWCADTAKRMQRVMASSNYYTSKAVQYLDLSIFGTAPMIIYEDADKVIRCFNPRAGEYYVAVGKNNTVDTLYRKFTMSVSAMVQEFGVDNVTDDIRKLWKDRKSLEKEVIVCHAIELNPDWVDGGSPQALSNTGVPRHFRWRETYWQFGSTEEKVLRVGGFLDQPFACPRWDAEGNDGYGRSPGMDALGDTKQLQVETKRKAQAIDKMVNPPMVGDVGMKNEPASLLPGAVTYVPNLSGGVGFKPAFTITPPIAELLKDLESIQGRIKSTFFNDLFLMISNLDTVRTATEIDARREEKLIQLGPVLERFDSEGLDPDVNRIFKIMSRRGLLMPMPQVMQGRALKVTYVSVLSDMQRATATSGIERLTQFIGNIAAAKPEALDKIDWDELIDEYADLLHVPPKVMANDQMVSDARKVRAQKNQAAAALQTSTAAVQGAETLSNTDVGGGQNALQMMLAGLNGGGAPGGGLAGATPAGNA